jgi:hypothetical protein
MMSSEYTLLLVSAAVRFAPEIKKTYMAKVKDISDEAFIVKLELDLEFTIGSPLWKRMKEERLIVIKSKVSRFLVATQVFSVQVVSWRRAAQVICARSVGAIGRNAWLEFILSIVGAIGKIGETKGMEVIGTISLVESVRFTDLHADRWVG